MSAKWGTIVSTLQSFYLWLKVLSVSSGLSKVPISTNIYWRPTVAYPTGWVGAGAGNYIQREETKQTSITNTPQLRAMERCTPSAVWSPEGNVLSAWAGKRKLYRVVTCGLGLAFLSNIRAMTWTPNDVLSGLLVFLHCWLVLHGHGHVW